MKNEEHSLKLQAHLDGELQGAESRALSAEIASDAELRAMYEELSSIKGLLLQTGELEVKVPESREFYWSKIERSIQSQSATVLHRPLLAGYPWWFRIFAPAAGVALLCTATVSIVKMAQAPSALTYLHEIETPLEDTSAISFHSPSAGMTVVWVQSQENQPDGQP
jgi:anti-sigma factor RsiW